jgi:hypothetical protein
MAVVGYVVIIGGLVAVVVLGLRWTRLRPGERRKTQYDYSPDDISTPPREIPPGDPIL